MLCAAKVSAASGGYSEPKQGQRSQSARGFCPRSTMRVPQPDIIEHFGNADAVPQPPERRLSRKAGIVRWCLKRFAFCPPVFSGGFSFFSAKRRFFTNCSYSNPNLFILAPYNKGIERTKAFRSPFFQFPIKFPTSFTPFFFQIPRCRSCSGQPQAGAASVFTAFFRMVSLLFFRARPCQKAFLPHNVCLFANKITICARITGNIARRGV